MNYLRPRWDLIAMPFRLARLSLERADQALEMPVRAVTVGRVADTWHAPRDGPRHEGQDIFAPRGTPVYSATRGIVIRVGENHLGGHVLLVYGPGGRSYYYAHLDRFAEGLRVGDRVVPSTVLGFVGNTGNARATPPHLHFGVYTRLGAINPYPLLRDRASAAAGS